MAAPAQHRKVLPIRAPLPRRTTRGPLDHDEDLLSPPTPLQSSLQETLTPLDVQPDTKPSLLQHEPITIPEPTSISVHRNPNPSKDLSFLFDPSIYHPLSQVDIPVPLRQPLPNPPLPSTSLPQILSQIDNHTSTCDFLGAAHLAATTLTTPGLVAPTDHATIFKLLSVRFSCLELMGQTLLAAQEAKALEDLSSDFYYIANDSKDDSSHTSGTVQQQPREHVMPFPLLLQATRLQTIGFSDPRRGITALYDIAAEIRSHLALPSISVQERTLLQSRLETLGTAVVNALIELGDTEGAVRLVQGMRPRPHVEIGPEGEMAMHKRQQIWRDRMVLLLIRLGRITEAQNYVETASPDGESTTALLNSLVYLSSGDPDTAAKILENTISSTTTTTPAPNSSSNHLNIILRQNLAVTYVYLGRVGDARRILEKLVDEGYGFESLTVNLGTVFDLVSGRAGELKMRLVEKVRENMDESGNGEGGRGWLNKDFKL